MLRLNERRAGRCLRRLQTDLFVEQCLDNPQEKAADVMSKVKGR